MIRFAVLFSLFLLACVPVARAAEINQAGAAQLKTLFTAFLNKQNSDLVHYEGEISVEPSGAFYAVTLPHVSVIYPDKERLEIGMVSINAAPGEEPGQWKMSVALPTPIILHGADGTVLREIHIADQRAALVWHENAQMLSALEASYRNITIDDKKRDLNVTIPDTTVILNLAHNKEAGTWTGPSEIKISHADIKFNGGKSTLNIGGIFAYLYFDAFSPASLKNKSLDLTTLADTISLLIELANIRIDDTGTDIRPPFKAEISNISGNIAMNGLRKNRAHTKFEASLLHVKADTAGQDPYPREARLKMEMSDIPLKELGALFSGIRELKSGQPEMAQIASLMLISKIPGMLGQSGAKITVPTSYITHPFYRADFDGNILADPAATNSMTGKAKLGITGLDWLTAALEKYRMPGLVEKLQIFRAISRVQANTNGTATNIVELEMNKEGKILLNGVNPENRPATPPSGDTAPPR